MSQEAFRFDYNGHGHLVGSYKGRTKAALTFENCTDHVSAHALLHYIQQVMINAHVDLTKTNLDEASLTLLFPREELENVRTHIQQVYSFPLIDTREDWRNLPPMQQATTALSYEVVSPLPPPKFEVVSEAELAARRQAPSGEGSGINDFNQADITQETISIPLAAESKFPLHLTCTKGGNNSIVLKINHDDEDSLGYYQGVKGNLSNTILDMIQDAVWEGEDRSFQRLFTSELTNNDKKSILTFKPTKAIAPQHLERELEELYYACHAASKPFAVAGSPLFSNLTKPAPKWLKNMVATGATSPRTAEETMSLPAPMMAALQEVADKYVKAGTINAKDAAALMLDLAQALTPFVKSRKR